VTRSTSDLTDRRAIISAQRPLRPALSHRRLRGSRGDL